MSDIVLASQPLAQPWPGVDPFLFCARHLDRYPAGTAEQGVPEKLLGGRSLGSDFGGKDGFSMYHGAPVPGFPAHPHRGFETVTVVTRGLVDHADSLGAAARYGEGDVQWLTAGRGVMHSEMFPLRNALSENPLDLYQIWLNLPARSKMAEPAFVMLWDGDIPRYRTRTAEGAWAEVKVIAGAYVPEETAAAPLTPPPAPPHSWASDLKADVAIWQIALDPGARVTLPPAGSGQARRTLYFHRGDLLTVAGQVQPGGRMVAVTPQVPLELANTGAETAEIMLLQGVPIGEPVAAYGPFVMNTQAEIAQARVDFGRTQFGGWPWEAPGPVHGRDHGRFARYPGSDEPNVPSGG